MAREVLVAGSVVVGAAHLPWGLLQLTAFAMLASTAEATIVNNVVVTSNTLGNDVGTAAAPHCMDVDGDGDVDCLVGNSDGYVRFYENMPTSSNPYLFYQRSTNLFSVDVGSYAKPWCGDLDNDGKLDCLVGQSDGYVYHFRNDAFRWTYVTSRFFQGFDFGSHASPFCADMDGDGLIDCLVGESGGRVWFLKRTSALITAFTRQSHFYFGQYDFGSWSSPTCADVDRDGVLECFVGNSAGVVTYMRQSADGNWVVESDSLFRDIGSNVAPTCADIDGDGDIDCLVGEWNGWVWLMRQQPAFTYEGALLGNPSGTRSSPMCVDMDKDGRADVVVGMNTGRVEYFRNKGKGPDFLFPLQTSNLLSNVPETFAAPSCFDVDGDGDIDCLVGTVSGKVHFHRNMTSGWALASSNYLSFDVGDYASPFCADMDGDGDVDCILGNSAGVVWYFKNNGGSYSRVTTNFFSYDVGSYAAPACYDLDNDGQLDCLVGEVNGRIFHFRNYGTSTNFDWRMASVDFFSRDFGSYSTISCADLDKDAGLDCLVGESGGKTYRMRQRPPQGPAFTLEYKRLFVAVGGSAHPHCVDLDGDGRLECLVGAADGLVQYYKVVPSPSPLPTTCAAVAGWATGIAGNGYGGIVEVWTEAFWQHNGYFELAWPIVRLGGSSLDGTWSLHAGSGNSNGQDACEAICKSFGSPGRRSGWSVPSGTGYPSGAASLASKCVYKRGPVSSHKNDWVANYGSTAACGNPMSHCQCQGTLWSNSCGNAPASPWSWARDNTNFFSFDVGSWAKPFCFDVDNDGDVDCLVGESNGLVRLFRNDRWSWVYATQNYFSYDVGSYSAPFCADMDADGDVDCLVGHSGGTVAYFRRDGSSWVFGSTDYFGLDIGSYAIPSCMDMDGDGDLDCLVGESGGFIFHFRNDGTPSSPTWVLVTRDYLGRDSGTHTAPFCWDMDGDGDVDCFVGDSNGQVYTFKNHQKGISSHTITTTQAPSTTSSTPATPTNCSAGSYVSGWYCVKCPAGRYDTRTSSTSRTCASCPPCTSAPAGSTSCKMLAACWLPTVNGSSVVFNVTHDGDGLLHMHFAMPALPATSQLHGSHQLAYSADLQNATDRLTGSSGCGNIWTVRATEMEVSMVYDQFRDLCSMNQTVLSSHIRYSGYAAVLVRLVSDGNRVVRTVSFPFEVLFPLEVVGAYDYSGSGTVQLPWHSHHLAPYSSSLRAFTSESFDTEFLVPVFRVGEIVYIEQVANVGKAWGLDLHWAWLSTSADPTDMKSVKANLTTLVTLYQAASNSSRFSFAAAQCQDCQLHVVSRLVSASTSRRLSARLNFAHTSMALRILPKTSGAMTEVSGTIDLAVADAAAFVADPRAQQGVAIGLRQLLGLPPTSPISVGLSLLARRSSTTSSASRASVGATYYIMLPAAGAGSQDPYSVRAALKSVSKAKLTQIVRSGLSATAALGTQPPTVDVISMTQQAPETPLMLREPSEPIIVGARACSLLVLMGLACLGVRCWRRAALALRLPPKQPSSPKLSQTLIDVSSSASPSRGRFTDGQEVTMPTRREPAAEKSEAALQELQAVLASRVPGKQPTREEAAALFALIDEIQQLSPSSAEQGGDTGGNMVMSV